MVERGGGVRGCTERKGGWEEAQSGRRRRGTWGGGGDSFECGNSNSLSAWSEGGK